MSAYYNEIDGYAAQWLRNLIAKGLIAPGDVDERSIVDVSGDDVRGYKQCHYFAGIGGWSLALRIAGWPDEREIWTGSCPCQPFSVAGRGLGTDDPRHLWPHMFRLISSCRPPVVMGEQVAGAAGYGWLDGVISDLEAQNYAGRGVDIPACSIDAPHIRSRLYWVARDMADTASGGWSQGVQQVQAGQAERAWGDRFNHRSGSGNLGDPNHQRLQEYRGLDELRKGKEGRQIEAGSAFDSGMDNVADSDRLRRPDERLDGVRRPEVHDADGRSEHGHMADANQIGCDGRPSTSGQQEGAGTWASHSSGTFWSDHIWLTGADGKARRAKPGLPLLAHGISGRVGRLRAYGNAIVPPLAAEVIKAYMECRP